MGAVGCEACRNYVENLPEQIREGLVELAVDQQLDILAGLCASCR